MATAIERLLAAKAAARNAQNSTARQGIDGPSQGGREQLQPEDHSQNTESPPSSQAPASMAHADASIEEPAFEENTAKSRGNSAHGPDRRSRDRVGNLQEFTLEEPEYVQPVQARTKAASTSDLLCRVPPQDIEAECGVLGSMLLMPEELQAQGYEELSGVLKDTDFYRESHREIWLSMGRVLARGQTIDSYTLTFDLRDRGIYDQVGGAGYFAELAACIPSFHNGLISAQRVHAKAALRELVQIGTSLASDAFENNATTTCNELVDRTQRRLSQVNGAADGNNPLHLYKDRLPVDAYEAWQVMKTEQRDYSWEGLIRDGCSAVLSGLMGSGKSTLGMNVARGWALGDRVLGRQCCQSRVLVVVSPKEFEAWAETIAFWELKGLIFLSKSTDAHFSDPLETVRWFEAMMDLTHARTFVLDTLFDFFGMPPNRAGDANRIAMAEQTPLLEMARQRGFSGLITGHCPKSEAKALDPRDPEEAFAGHTAWTAQHRMRMTIRRKSQGVNALITGKGGHGDAGILQEQLVEFDEATRIVTLGGAFAEYLGRAAWPTVKSALDEAVEPMPRTELEKKTGKGRNWVLAGLKEGRKQGDVQKTGTSKATKYYLTGKQVQDDLL